MLCPLIVGNKGSIVKISFPGSLWASLLGDEAASKRYLRKVLPHHPEEKREGGRKYFLGARGTATSTPFLRVIGRLGVSKKV